MRIHLLASTCAVALAAMPAHAETTISTATTAPVTTGTIKTGGDDIKITSAGSIKPAVGAATTAVTISSNHKLINEGTIQYTTVDGARGIVAEAGITSEITNGGAGKIILDEAYSPTDTDKDGDLDGPFTTGSNRIGIETRGAFTGNITNDGQITVRGNDSYGVKLGGTLTGKFSNDGQITVTGNNAAGVQLQDASSNVRLAGSISATGSNAVAARLTGNIGGSLEVQGNLTATGYRYTTPPADPSKLDADDLLQGGPALSVEGSVNGGIRLAVPPKDTNADNKDEDGDGIEDAKEGSANVRSFGKAAAMRIGHATNDISIGAVAGSGTGNGLIIDGHVLGSGLYAGIDGNGLQIGRIGSGDSSNGVGGNVTIAGGIGINGSVIANSRDAAATALHIGAGATVPTIQNTGRIEAVTDGNAAGSIASALKIEQGSSVDIIRNSGQINAKTGGDNGTARAIHDLSGNVGLIENSGVISATGAQASSGRNVAIDVSANSDNVSIRQTAVATGFAAPSISGDILFGTGNNLLTLEDGSMKGKAQFGAGANEVRLSGDATFDGTAAFGSGNDRFNLAGTSRFSGTADFGGGTDTLSITDKAVFSGNITNAANLAATVSGGTLGVKGSAQIASLAISNGGALAVTLGGSDATNLQINGDASFAENSKLVLQLSNITQGEGRHIVVTAGSLTGADKLQNNSDLVPFLYKGTLSHTGTQIIVDVARKGREELGLNRSEAALFNAAITAAAKDNVVEGAILSIRDQDNFRRALQQMMPEHEGGVFETVTSGSRTLSRWLIDPNAPFKDEGKWGWFVNQAVWGTSKSIGDTASYDVSGWGINMGGEIKTGLGNFGASAAFLAGKDGNGANQNEITTSQWEGALHWRLISGKFAVHARASGAPISITGTRIFDMTGKPEKTMRSKWDATLYSASGGISYDAKAGGFTLRPTITMDYYKLSEKSYQEAGGGDALDLSVAGRSSDELALNGTLAIGLQFGGQDAYAGVTRFELEGGRREILQGALGLTTASFKSGQSFTLTPEERTSGWVGRLRGMAGNSGFQFGGEISAEQQQGHTAWAVRANLRIGL